MLLPMSRIPVTMVKNIERMIVAIVRVPRAFMAHLVNPLLHIIFLVPIWLFLKKVSTANCGFNAFPANRPQHPVRRKKRCNMYTLYTCVSAT